MEKELLDYLKENELTKEDIQNAFEKLRKYEEAINKAQRITNEGRADELYYANNINEVKNIASDAKMEIFRLWYLVHTGKEYQL